MSGSDPLSPPRGERAGQPSRSTEDWSRLDDDFRRIPLNVRMDRIGATGAGIVIKEVADDTAWTDRPWAEREGIRSFAAHPLLFRDEVLGVLSIFTRTALAGSGRSSARAGIASTTSRTPGPTSCPSTRSTSSTARPS